MIQCKTVLCAQTENANRCLEEIDGNLKKFDEMVKEMSDDPVKAITLHATYEACIAQAREQLATGLKSQSNTVASLGRRLQLPEHSEDLDVATAHDVNGAEEDSEREVFQLGEEDVPEDDEGMDAHTTGAWLQAVCVHVRVCVELMWTRMH